MLTQLTINNFAIVEQLDIDLASGMTVITGETGAGKSIMLDALGLTLGDRADKDVIRAGAKRADICATFNISQHSNAKRWLDEHDFDADDDECLLRRVITAEGRSRAYINGQQTTLNELKALGEMLVDIHSQHEHQSLLRASTHQRLLDEYGKLQAQAAAVVALAEQWRRLHSRLQSFQESAADNNAQLELLSYQVQELDELGLEMNELATLEDEHQRLSNAGSTLDINQRLLDLCNENEQFNLVHGLNQAQSLLEQLPYKGKYAEEAAKLIESARIQVEEASTEISHAVNAIELDPQRLEEVEERLQAIHQMARKHRVSPSDIPPLHEKLQLELSQMSESDTTIEAMEKELATRQSDWQKAADTLSKARAKSAKKLESEINDYLKNLGMANASFRLALNSQPGGEPRNNGYESTEFLVSTNPGSSPKPMIKIASGGELSRISLAIQVATAQTSSIPTLVFDEVDVGIGGGVARTVGELLRQLGEKGQAICVTHQPQVASQGHQHLFVSKLSGDSSTSTQVRELDEQQKVEEIARMLGGDELTEQSLAHAREMIA